MTSGENGREGEDEQPWEGDDHDAPQDTPGDGADTAQLAFGGREEQLPWLESGDDYAEQGVDTARIIAFALIGLLLIGVVVGGIWWFSQERGDSALVADGSTIEAPEGPIKTRPEDPGGKTYEDASAYAVGEGQVREGMLATEIEPRPSVDAATVASTQAAAAAAPKGGGVGVQVGAYSTRARAEQGWTSLVQRHSVLQGAPHRVIEADADIGRVFRLQAVAANRSTADSMCASVKAGGGACQVKP